MQDRHEVVLEANITGFKQKIKEAEKTAENTAKKIQNSLDMSQVNKAMGLRPRENEHYTMGQYKKMVELQKQLKVKNLAIEFNELTKSMKIFDGEAQNVASETKEMFKIADVEKFNQALQNTRKFVEDAYGNPVEIRKQSEEIGKLNEYYARQQKILSEITLAQKNMGGLFTSGRLEKAGGYSGNMAYFGNGLRENIQNTQQLSSNVTGLGASIENAFSKGLKSVKRLTIGFLGARSAFMLFRKYLGEYSRQNEEFAQKMQLTTSVITNALAPAFEWFGNVIQYAVIGLARIIELLTGINILGKTVDNSLKGASKSAKELNDNLSGLDEISNIQEDSGGLSTGIGSQLNALDEFQKKIKEVDEWLAKTGIKKFLEDTNKFISGLWNGFQNQPKWLKWFEAGALTIGLLLGKSGGTAGLFGVALVLGTIAAINIKAIADAWTDLLESTKQFEKTADDLIKKWENLQDETKGFVEGLSDEETKKVFGKFDSLANNTLSDLESKLKDLEKYEHFPFRTDPNKKKDQKLLAEYVTMLMTYIKTEKEAFEQGKLTDEQQNQYKQTLEKTKEKLESAKKAGYDYKFELKEINDQLNVLNSKNVTATVKVTADMTEFRKALERYKNVNLGGIGVGFQNLPSYDVGTNYVPRDQIALVHEGERIIPKQYNNSDYLGQMGNSETNMLLMELNRSILEFANREQTFEVNGKELAKVTYSDFQEEGSRRGTNTSIRRV